MLDSSLTQAMKSRDLLHSFAQRNMLNMIASRCNAASFIMAGSGTAVSCPFSSIMHSPVSESTVVGFDGGRCHASSKKGSQSLRRSGHHGQKMTSSVRLPIIALGSAHFGNRRRVSVVRRWVWVGFNSMYRTRLWHVHLPRL